jgi:uncharacterized damage-inducible protein DinB
MEPHVNNQQPSLAHCYRGWDLYQNQLTGIIRPLTTEQLDLRATPRLRSIGEQVAHMIATRARWLSLDLHEGGTTLERFFSWDGWTESGPIEPSPRTAAELVEGLETTWQVMQAALERWTVVDLDEVFPPAFPGEESFTRQYVIWHLIEHDVHHGGELSFLLGMNDLPGLDL